MTRRSIALMLVATAACYLCAFGGYRVGRDRTTALEVRAKALCRDGVVANDGGGYVCFTENPNIKQWRPRWSHATVLVKGVDYD